jgi:hypothetical protein
VCSLRTQQCVEHSLTPTHTISTTRTPKDLCQYSVFCQCRKSASASSSTSTEQSTTTTGGQCVAVLLRKEVIQPHLPVRLPCYDFVPIASPTFDHSLPYGLGHGLRVLPTFVT